MCYQQKKRILRRSNIEWKMRDAGMSVFLRRIAARAKRDEAYSGLRFLLWQSS